MATRVRQNFSQYLKSLHILYFALLAGQLICLVVFYFLPPTEGKYLPSDGLIVRIPILIAILGAAGVFLGYKRIVYARDKSSLQEKMETYRSALILRWALLEGAVLLAGILFFISRSYFLLGMATACLGAFILFVPGRNRLMSDLDLSSSEQAMLDDPNTIVAEIEQRGL